MSLSGMWCGIQGVSLVSGVASFGEGVSAVSPAGVVEPGALVPMPSERGLGSSLPEPVFSVSEVPTAVVAGGAPKFRLLSLLLRETQIKPMQRTIQTAAVPMVNLVKTSAALVPKAL